MNDNEKLYEALEAAATHWQSHARCATSYLRGRGLAWLAEDPAAYGLGYALYQWTELIDTLRDRGINDETIEDAGLAIRTRDGRLIDRFRGRLMFPIRDHVSGRVAGATGRDLTRRPGVPKYLNTPTTRVFEKRRLLYGLSEQTSKLRNAHTLVITEGPLDALAIQGRSVAAVGTCGTALTLYQVTSLASRTSNNHLVLGFDGDRPGLDATIRAYKAVVDWFSNVHYLPLEQVSDLADLDRPSGSQLLSQSRPVADLIIDKRMGEVDPSDAFAAINAARRAARTLSDMPAHEWLPQISRIAARAKLSPTTVMGFLTTAFHPTPSTPLTSQATLSLGVGD